MSDDAPPHGYPVIPLHELPCISCEETTSTHRTPDGWPICNECDTALTQDDISYRRTFQGMWALSAMVDGHRVERLYMGWTKGEATELFLKEFNP